MEAEYIIAGLCCVQILWIRHTLKDYDIQFDTTRILCDNISAIYLSKKSTSHSQTNKYMLDIVF